MLGTIELTAEEAALLRDINFSWRLHDELRLACERAGELTPMLLRREAIPANRLRYFDDPEYNGGKKSRMEVFIGNGTSGAEIFSHGNFLRHLRYFIHGADLPDQVKAEMAEAVGEPAHFYSGELEPITRMARRLARSTGRGSACADDFFQLMSDIGVGPHHAESIRKTVKTVR
ncbi:hypothetical protein [Pusillimonas noertemannii]|uniref:Uncharacterized protein n=1 Tax=Pusillimonas noertemannii TaxID=305977 RepID=A0A2U1CM91_9BURK|nr:hypothetical protein [Pusillimonas noertemannii]NYT68842.1 hypothetical protein [Pusillimonas noertemannii]PVY62136.1 hypothetical protein C7440_1628 [Pusillimonas noertemannii]TFL10874.1 hypothetical protein CSC72_10215 [Pusillimonas noertemannii]